MTPHGNATGQVRRKYFRGKETSTIPLLRPPTRENFRGFNWAESTLPHSVLGMLLFVRMGPCFAVCEDGKWSHCSLVCHAALVTHFLFGHLKPFSFPLHTNTSRLKLQGHLMVWLPWFSLPCIVHCFICTCLTSLNSWMFLEGLILPFYSWCGWYGALRTQ